MSASSTSAGFGTLAALAALIVASLWLGQAAHRAVQRGAFLKGYFLGNRGLGAWALALTATVQSGGTFMGFPSLVYSHGWIVILWIASYMVVPLMAFGAFGKRLGQISRATGAITVPDLFRERFGSPALALVASLLIMFFMSFMMVAQFKAGALIMKTAWPGSGALAVETDAAGGLDRYYYIGLVIFACTVVAYTVMGGFLAAVWTDLFQSVMMLGGVLLLLALVVPAAGGLEQATRTAVAHTSPDYAFGPGYARDARAFLPPSLAFSFFFVWTIANLGNPSAIVRVMASKSTAHIRRSIVLLNGYNALIYVPLVVICICGRSLIPELPAAQSDEIVPRLALATTSPLPGGSFWAGLILAAPFGAVMATVSGYLVVIASGLVHDVYQRFIHPAATERRLRRLTYGVMVVIGCIAFAANIKPVDYLQAIVIFSGTGAAATFAVPMLMIAYWRRATVAGAMAAMIAGAVTMLALFVTGWLGPDPMIGHATKFRPCYLLGLEPIVWGLAASTLAGVAVSLLTRPPAPERVGWLFDASQCDGAVAKQAEGPDTKPVG